MPTLRLRSGADQAHPGERSAQCHSILTAGPRGRRHAPRISLVGNGHRAGLWPGAPESILQRIFDPFFRVDEARDSDRGEVELGLSIARRAVALHGGKITARNASPGLLVAVELQRSRSNPSERRIASDSSSIH